MNDDDNIEVVSDKHISDKHISDKHINDKIDLMNFNNGWNDKNENLLISIGENAASYKWMHEASSNYHNTIHNIISIALVVLSSLLSIQTLFPNESSVDVNFVVVITKQVVLYIVTILSFLQSFLNSQVLSQKHFFASGLFSELYHDIQEQMCMFRRDRINATKYVSDCLKQYDTLIINSPDINLHVVRMFKKTFKNTDISLPDIADKIQKIEIITEDVNNGDDYKNTSISSSKKNCNNLQEIHNAFQIQGDITDKELENINYTDLRKKFLKQKSEYEYNRFLQHSQELD